MAYGTIKRSRVMADQVHCANCTCLLTDRVGESSIYSPSRTFILCESCFDAEDEMIERAGTNVDDKVYQRYVANVSVFG